MSTDDPVLASASPPHPHCSAGAGDGQQSVYLPGRESAVPPGACRIDARQFLRLVHGDLRGHLVTLTGKHVMKGGRQQLVSRRQRYWSHPGQVEEAAAYLLKESDRGREAYFSVSLFVEPGTRKEEHALGVVRCLWMDTDGAPLPRTFPQPDILVESSPGRYHAYWMLSRGADVTFATDLTRRLAHWAGADTGKWGITTVLRVPGSQNYKPDRSRNEVIGWLTHGGPRDACDLERLVPSARDLGLPGMPAEGRRKARTRTPAEDEPRARPARRNGGGLPPPLAALRLSGRALRIVLGQRPIRTPSGRVDRSRTLFQIGGVLHSRGLRGGRLAEALQERDSALGYRKYISPYRPERYAEISRKLDEDCAGGGSGPRSTVDASLRTDALRRACSGVVRRAVGEPWKGRHGPTDFAVLVALAAAAFEHGVLVGDEPRVCLASRPLALAAGLGRRQTAARAAERLEAAGWIRTAGTLPERGTVYAIVPPTCADQYGSHTGGGCEPFGPRMWKLFCRFRRPDPQPAPGQLGRMGKLHALILAKVVLAGGMSLEALEAATGRRRDSLGSRHASDLVSVGLLAWHGDVLVPPRDIARRLASEHEVTGVVEEEKLQRARDLCARRAWQMAYTEWRYGPPPDENDAAEISDLARQGEAERRRAHRRTDG